MFTIEIDGNQHVVHKIDRVADYNFGHVNFVSVNKICSDIKSGRLCSAIMIVNGREYYINKNPLTIHDGKGQSIDVGSNFETLSQLNNDQTRISSFLDLVNHNSIDQVQQVDVTMVTLFQSCSDCLADAYCKMNCTPKNWCCSWSKGCGPCFTEDELFTSTSSVSECDILVH